MTHVTCRLTAKNGDQLHGLPLPLLCIRSGPCYHWIGLLQSNLSINAILCPQQSSGLTLMSWFCRACQAAWESRPSPAHNLRSLCHRTAATFGTPPTNSANTTTRAAQTHAIHFLVKLQITFEKKYSSVLYFVSAAVAVDSSHTTASSSAS